MATPAGERRRRAEFRAGMPAPFVVSTAPVEARLAATLVGSGRSIDEQRSQDGPKIARAGSETFCTRARVRPMRSRHLRNPSVAGLRRSIALRDAQTDAWTLFSASLDPVRRRHLASEREPGWVKCTGSDRNEHRKFPIVPASAQLGPAAKPRAITRPGRPRAVAGQTVNCGSRTGCCRRCRSRAAPPCRWLYRRR